ncbi:DUF1501 domain-containing protein [Tautonia rosea]|uniref:DUF1501 domain-containing protein n=1 Tax=Tautonia rosea TaxID=2728037 RepID=UPI001472AB2C|nr:DUF1501 domain-containing protein [Tautonia rosea]
MTTRSEPQVRCPGPRISRRALLRTGGLGGLGLLGLMRAAQASGGRSTAPGDPPPIRACILVFYYGGPSHFETFDPKPEAPLEVRGEFRPIATSAPGVFVSELQPKMATVMHKVALIRSMTHGNRLHDSASMETLTGRPAPQGDQELFSPEPQFYPSFGGALSYLRRSEGLAVPHAALPFVFHNVVDVPCQGGGFLGSAYDPFQVLVDMADRSYQAALLRTPADLPPTRRGRRRALLDAMEGATLRGEPLALADSYDRAYRLLASEHVRKALEIDREDPKVRDRYGYDHPPASVGAGGGGGNGAELGIAREMRGQNLLMARRLVEAGVPFVNVYDFRQQGQNWDAHFKVFDQHRDHLVPVADQSLAALIEDLDARGLLDSTLVVALGEFGRTPRINNDAGRDHWPDCYSAVLAGGGVKGGFVLGSSDRLGAYPASDPVTPADLAATIYWRFGFDPSLELHDTTDRPHPLATGRPVRSLFA